MPDLLKNTYNDFESLRGRRLVVIIVTLVILFIPLGVLIGYITNEDLNGGDPTDTESGSEASLNLSNQYKGKITYLDPMNYPEDEITYVLTGQGGNEIILLKSNEKILEVSEGLTASVTGKLRETFDGTEKYLLVTEVTISNVTD